MTDGSARRIVLCGSAGAGKSTVARWLGRELAAPVLDVDTWITRAAGAPYGGAGDYLAAVGESAFRASERDVLAAMDNATSSVVGTVIVALGGGSITDAGFTPRATDTVVHLRVPANVATDRIAEDAVTRPLAADPEMHARRIAAQDDVHAAVATVSVDAGGPLTDVGHDVARAIGLSLPPEPQGLLAGPGALQLCAEPGVLDAGDVHVFVDEAVSRLGEHVAALARRSGCGTATVHAVPAGAWAKQLGQVERCLSLLADAGVRKDSLVVAVGGGTVTDVVGLAAALYARGIAWITVPTTLVGQVDAAIGGKTGVDLGTSRNRIGAIHMPRTTIIDPQLLAGLPPREVRAGIAELGKTALLRGRDAWDRVRNLDPHTDPAADGKLHAAIVEAACFKRAIVATDPLDDGHSGRWQLNLGHTFAHAAEAAGNHAIGHGEAVALGLRAAARLAEAAADAPPELTEEIDAWCSRWEMGRSRPVTAAALREHLTADKKWRSDGDRWVILDAPGAPRLVGPGLIDAASAAWDALPASSDAEVPDTAQRPVMVLFGVNLGDLGDRPTEVYGPGTYAQLAADIAAWGQELGHAVDIRQTDNLERFIAAIREARAHGWPLIINPGAWTHTEPAIADALEPHTSPVVEVHLSDPQERESWRHTSVVEEHAAFRVAGRGADGYRVALEWLASDAAAADRVRHAASTK